MFGLFQRVKENAHKFLDEELKKLWRVHFPDYPHCSESLREKDDVVDEEDEEQRKHALEGVLDITLLCLKQLKLEQLANILQNGTGLFLIKHIRGPIVTV